MAKDLFTMAVALALVGTLVAAVANKASFKVDCDNNVVLNGPAPGTIPALPYPRFDFLRSHLRKECRVELPHGNIPARTGTHRAVVRGNVPHPLVDGVACFLPLPI
jgi:hypothetical protein